MCTCSDLNNRIFYEYEKSYNSRVKPYSTNQLIANPIESPSSEVNFNSIHETAPILDATVADKLSPTIETFIALDFNISLI